MPFLLFAAIFWVAPIVAGHKIGAGKNRAGWAWGLLLGWIGVLIVALLGPAKKTENRSLRFTAPNDAAKPRAVATRIGPPPNILAAGWYPDPQDAVARADVHRAILPPQRPDVRTPHVALA